MSRSNLGVGIAAIIIGFAFLGTPTAFADVITPVPIAGPYSRSVAWGGVTASAKITGHRVAMVSDRSATGNWTNQAAFQLGFKGSQREPEGNLRSTLHLHRSLDLSTHAWQGLAVGDRSRRKRIPDLQGQGCGDHDCEDFAQHRHFTAKWLASRRSRLYECGTAP